MVGLPVYESDSERGQEDQNNDYYSATGSEAIERRAKPGVAGGRGMIRRFVVAGLG